MIRPRSSAYHAGHGTSASATLSTWLVRAETIWRHTSVAISSARAIAGGLAASELVDQVPGGRVEIADIDRQHRDVAVAGQDRSLLPQAVLVDRRQRPLRPRVVHVPSEQLEFRVEVVLDAAQASGTGPRAPAPFRPWRRDPAGPAAGSTPGCSGPLGGGTEVVNPSSPATVPPVPAARIVAVIRSAAGASTATTV